MTPTLSPITIAIVKATVPALAEHGTAITTNMYKRLFKDEHIKALFNHSNQGEGGAQVHALAAAILGYARNIDNLGVVAPVVERIAHKHVGFHILPEHYPFVARALLDAIKDTLGDAATEDVLTAWAEAYWFLAEILMARELEIRAKIEAFTGGWSGWREFEVIEKRVESSLITSFTLRPADGLRILRHKPGQYLTFRLPVPGGYPVKRNYSISCAPNDDHYRISVKREAFGQGGSLYLHDCLGVGDILEVTPPAGNFFLPDQPQRPVILLSGGVGLTPMVSMLETIAEMHPDLPTYYIHGTLNSATHAFDSHVRDLAAKHGSISVVTFYNEPSAADLAETGFITVNWLLTHTPLRAADVFLCGPKPFLRTLITELIQAGIASDRIHFEFFGPTDEELAA